MEVTKDEQRKLDDLFRKIADRDEFVAQQRQAAETLRRKEAEPPVTVWAVVDNYTLRDWGQEGFNICGVYLTLDEAVAHIHVERERHKGEGPLEDIFGDGESTRWSYTEWDAAHNYGIGQAPILSTFVNGPQPEVDLKKEIDRELDTRWRGEYLSTSKFRESARHFYELGRRADK